MLISRAKTLFRLLHSKNVMQNVRNMSDHAEHGFMYRTGPLHPPSKKVMYLSELAGGIMWWWILWHFWHDYEHVTGEFAYPDPSKWTNEELGIPNE